MKKNNFFHLSLFIFQVFFTSQLHAALCKKSEIISIEMDETWQKKELLRIEKENELLSKYPEYITKRNKPLIKEKYRCKKGDCDPLRNCQMHNNPEKFYEVEYLIAVDTGITLAKSYCSEIGQCIGYNDFNHNLKVTASEDRLIDIKKDNAIFYHYFYSTNPQNYEAPFVMINFHTGSELALRAMPQFSPDETKMIEVYSVKEQQDSEIKNRFFINLYEMNKYGEYEKIKESNEFDQETTNQTLTESKASNSDTTTKLIDDFLLLNPSCGPTPHFHSWKNNYEIRLSMLAPKQANKGRKVILFYDRKSNKWQCQDEIFPEFKCQSYLPKSLRFVSNLDEEQIAGCEDYGKHD